MASNALIVDYSSLMGRSLMLINRRSPPVGSEDEKPSPFPWRIEPLELYEGGIGYQVLDADGNTVFDNQTYYNQAPTETDARIILKAIEEASREG